MKLVIVSVRDTKANAFGIPVCVPTVGAAVRSFSDQINGQDSVLTKHPQDFDLFELGTFDDNTGLFDTHTPSLVTTGLNLVQRPAENPAQLQLVK